MADKEYINRGPLLKSKQWLAFPDLYRASAKAIILGQQVADVVEVVRCKDCKHRYVPTRCALWYATVDDTEYFVERSDDFYCSYGEAKMDGKGECE